LLNDPLPPSLLCIETPENNIYPLSFWRLAEEFRHYSMYSGQIMLSTHSSDLPNATKIQEVYWLVKKDGFTEARMAADDKQVAAYMADGDQMGYLWREGLFVGVNPA
jgi:predicted ATPase